jgi:hypothetical protein
MLKVFIEPELFAFPLNPEIPDFGSFKDANQIYY